MLQFGDKIKLRSDHQHIGEIVGVNLEDKIYTVIFNGIRFQISVLAFDNLMRKAEPENKPTAIQPDGSGPKAEAPKVEAKLNIKNIEVKKPIKIHKGKKGK